MPFVRPPRFGFHPGLRPDQLTRGEALAIILLAGRAAGYQVVAPVPARWKPPGDPALVSDVDAGWVRPADGRIIVGWVLLPLSASLEQAFASFDRFTDSDAPLRNCVRYSVDDRERPLIAPPGIAVEGLGPPVEEEEVRGFRMVLPIGIRTCTDEQLLTGKFDVDDALLKAVDECCDELDLAFYESDFREG